MLVLFTLALPSTANIDTLGFTATYNLNPPRAEMRIQVNHSEANTFYLSKTISKGMLAQLFVGSIITNSTAIRDAQNRLVPLLYEYKITSRPQQDQKYEFDWEQKHAIVNYQNEQYKIALTEDVLDENIVLLRHAPNLSLIHISEPTRPY